jgi:hypothetical protein
MLAAVGLSSGHAALADFVFLVAAIVFLLAALVRGTGHAEPRIDGALISLGLALVALGWFVL